MAEGIGAAAGDLSVEAGLHAELEAELVRGFFGREPDAAEQGRIVIYRAMSDLWGCSGA